MSNKYMTPVYLAFLLIAMAGCKSKIKQQDDELYSRHLQRHVKLTIISTPMPDDKSELNLLLLNDGQEMKAFRVKEIVDSLYRKKMIQPLLVVGIHAGDRIREYGVKDHPAQPGHGDRAGYYAAFIDDELYPFAKKKATVRKFRSVAIAGCSLGGLSAFDMAWDNSDKIGKVGVFSGSFGVRDNDENAGDHADEKNRIMLNKIISSRKKPHLQYWFYTCGKEETGGLNKEGINDVTDVTGDLIELIKSKNVCPPGDIRYIKDANGKPGYASWSAQLPAFLIWAFGK